MYERMQTPDSTPVGSQVVIRLSFVSPPAFPVYSFSVVRWRICTYDNNNNYYYYNNQN